MKTLVIDIGSYSVKTIDTFVEKKKVVHQQLNEVVIDQFLEHEHSQLTKEEAIDLIIKQELAKYPDHRTIYQLPNPLLSMRFLDLPVTNRKKAKMIIPFQLEEEIPFPYSEIHSASLLIQHKKSISAIITYLHKHRFEEYFQHLVDKNIIPDIITCEASAYQSYMRHHKINYPICVLDLGHSTTKAYFFNNQQLVGYHVSYLAGNHITEVIATNYKITNDEATIYKHQNGFLLTEEQYCEVNESQQNFARLMDKTLAPLISEFKRWEIGFRVKYGLKINQILMTGGTSNFKNINNYFTEVFGIKTRHLKSFDGVILHNVDNDIMLQNRFATANLMATNLLHKNFLLNFKSGAYASKHSENIPLYSGSFIGARLAFLFFILTLTLFMERIMIQSDIKLLNKKIVKLIKNPNLGIRNRLERQFARKPNERTAKTIFNKISKEKRAIDQESRIIKEAANIDALTPLLMLSKSLKGSKTLYLRNFTSNNDQITAIFKASAY
ncbi:MAG: pilus assembly protein PilM, partial [Bacteriovoracia bacterium]